MNKMNLAVAGLVCLLFFSFGHAQEKSAVSPPAVVVVSEVKAGTLAPGAEFVGTVFYPEVSDVAAETSGRIESVRGKTSARCRLRRRPGGLGSDTQYDRLDGRHLSSGLGTLQRPRQRCPGRHHFFNLFHDLRHPFAADVFHSGREKNSLLPHPLKGFQALDKRRTTDYNKSER